MLARLSAEGADPEAVRRALAEQSALALLPDNMAAWEAFAVVCRQWRHRPDGRLLGLDYAAAAAGWALSGIEVAPGDFLRVRILESAVVEAVNGQQQS